MCASLKLRGATLNENGMRQCNPTLIRTRPLFQSSASTVASSKPGALTHGHLRLNRQCNAGDVCQ